MRVADPVVAIDQQGGKGGANYAVDVMPTMCSDSHGTPHAVAYTMVVRSGCDADANGRSAGKGALIQTERASTLNTVQDQYLFQPAYSIENHPADSRVNIDESGKVQTLTSRMGTGGGNVPMVLEPKLMDAYQHHGWRESGTVGTLTTDGAAHVRGDTPLVCEPVVYDGANVTSPVNASNPQPGDPSHTLSTDSRNYLVVPVYCLQGNGIDRADTAGCNGKGVKEDICYTLNTIDRPAVAYSADPIALDRAAYNQGANAQYKPQFIQDGTVPTLIAKGPGAVAHVDVAGVDCRNAEETPELNGTLQAKPNGGFSPNYNQVVRVRYIVRRLTPTECARLQGFADWWGHIEPKHSLTDEEHRFWMDVRNTHAAINGKAVKEYNKTQMLTWYNKLWSDGAEYKMWGNGIALPPALYCMQGIVEVLNREEDDSWML